MKEEFIKLEDCKPGDLLSRDVIDVRTGIVLCDAGQTMTKETISWLEKFVCSELYIETDSWNKVWNLSDAAVESFETDKKQLNDLLVSLKDSKSIDSEKLCEIQDNFYGQLSQNNTIMGCVNIVKNLDEYTYAHSMNVGMLSVLIGRWCGVTEEQEKELFLAGILHDAGKYKIDPKIMFKKGIYTPVEYSLAKKHVVYSYDLIKEDKNITDATKMGILSHHERIDGSGYPRELAGDEIPFYGKILAIADMYDAMISERVYKKRMTPFEVMERMLRESINKLDTKMLLTFLTHIADYYIGVFVKLSTGDVGEVVFVHPHCVYRPIVKVDETYVDLDTQKEIKILDII